MPPITSDPARDPNRPLLGGDGIRGERQAGTLHGETARAGVSDAQTARAGETEMIPVVREFVHIGKRTVESGRVVVHKTTVERDETVEAMLLREDDTLHPLPDTLPAPPETLRLAATLDAAGPRLPAILARPGTRITLVGPAAASLDWALAAARCWAAYSSPSPKSPPGRWWDRSGGCTASSSSIASGCAPRTARRR